MGRRVGAVAGTAGFFIFILWAPAPASACDEPSQGDLGAVSGRAGETVSFALPGTPQGAQYAVAIEGAAAGGGSDDDPAPGTQASLRIPDLGAAAREVEAVVSVSCEDGGGWQRSLAVHYTGRAPAPPAPAQPAPPAAGGVAVSPRAEAPASRYETGARRPSRRSRGGGAVKGFRRSFSGLGPALLDVTDTRGRARKAEKRKERQKRKRKARRREAQDRDDASAGPAPPSVGGGGADLSGGDVDIPGLTVAWRLLAAVALVGIVTIALLARRTRRRRLLPR